MHKTKSMKKQEFVTLSLVTNIVEKTIKKSLFEQNIMVEAPYNILSKYQLQTDDSITAKVKNKYWHENEGGPISCAEFGRHLAILGSIILAHEYQHNQKHYFLANHADLKRVHENVTQSEEFTISARVVSKGKRKAVIEGVIHDSFGIPVYKAVISYQVMHPKIFNRFFSKYKLEHNYTNKISPYIQRKNLTQVEIIRQNATATYGIIEANDCEGHFEAFPALPVALVGGLFCELGMHLVRSVLPYQTIIALTTDIKANKLPFVGEELQFEGFIAEQINSTTFRIQAQAKIGEEIVGEADFVLKGIQL